MENKSRSFDPLDSLFVVAVLAWGAVIGIDWISLSAIWWRKLSTSIASGMVFLLAALLIKGFIRSVIRWKRR